MNATQKYVRCEATDIPHQESATCESPTLAATVRVCTNGDGAPITSGHNTLIAWTLPTGAVRREWVATRNLDRELVTA